MLALKSEKLILESVTTVSGNVHVDKSTENALKILELMGRKDIPVAKGAAKPLKKELRTAEYIHGEDGLGDSNLPEPKISAIRKNATELIIEKIIANPREITLVTIGPLTNIALAIEEEPEIISKTKEIILMGGAYGVTPYGYGNVTPVAEFNIYTDPEAAKMVFESGMKITAVGLDITRDPEALLTEEDFRRIKEAGTETAKMVLRIIRRPMELSKRLYGCRAIPMHDAMAVSYLLAPELFTVKKYRVDIETRGEFTLGQTVTDRRVRGFEGETEIKNPNVYVCTTVKGREFINLLIEMITR